MKFKKVLACISAMFFSFFSFGIKAAKHHAVIPVLGAAGVGKSRLIARLCNPETFLETNRSPGDGKSEASPFLIDEYIFDGRGASDIRFARDPITDVPINNGHCPAIPESFDEASFEEILARRDREVWYHWHCGEGNYVEAMRRGDPSYGGFREEDYHLEFEEHSVDFSAQDHGAADLETIKNNYYKCAIICLDARTVTLEDCYDAYDALMAKTETLEVIFCFTKIDSFQPDEFWGGFCNIINPLGAMKCRDGITDMHCIGTWSSLSGNGQPRSDSPELDNEISNVLYRIFIHVPTTAPPFLPDRRPDTELMSRTAKLCHWFSSFFGAAPAVRPLPVPQQGQPLADASLYT